MLLALHSIVFYYLVQFAYALTERLAYDPALFHMIDMYIIEKQVVLLLPYIPVIEQRGTSVFGRCLKQYDHEILNMCS